MNLKNIFGAKVKKIEVTQKSLEVVQGDYNSIQQELSEKNTQKQQLAQALNVISASLVISPNDKTATAQKKKAEEKIAELNKEIEKLNEMAQKTQGELSQARREHLNAKGEKFAQEQVEFAVSGKLQRKLEVLTSQLSKELPKGRTTKWIDWSRAYGLPVESYETPYSGTQYKERKEDVPFFKEKIAEIDSLAEQKAEELIAKVEKTIYDALEAEGIKLNK